MSDSTATIEAIERHKLVAVIRTPTPEEAYEAAVACARGGMKLIEITFSVPGADDVIKAVKGKEGVTVGAGTVLNLSEAERANKAGAAFIVSPHTDEEIVRYTKSSGMVSVPGACTPTEVLKAHRAGADIIKLFPFVEMGGLKFLRTLRGPLPFIKYMPSGGVTLENVTEYLAAGVSGVIVGSALVKGELVRARDWQAIEGLARRFVEKLPYHES